MNNAVPRRRATRTGTLAFVSGYRDSQQGIEFKGRLYTREEWEQADRFILDCLIRYARDHGKKFSIICCSDVHTNSLRNDKEKHYYRNLLGHDCDLLQKQGWHSGYDATDESEVVVSIDSTLGYESAARGNKTAILSVRLEPWRVPGTSEVVDEHVHRRCRVDARTSPLAE